MVNLFKSLASHLHLDLYGSQTPYPRVRDYDYVVAAILEPARLSSNKQDTDTKESFSMHFVVLSLSLDQTRPAIGRYPAVASTWCLIF